MKFLSIRQSHESIGRVAVDRKRMARMEQGGFSGSLFITFTCPFPPTPRGVEIESESFRFLINESGESNRLRLVCHSLEAMTDDQCIQLLDECDHSGHPSPHTRIQAQTPLVSPSGLTITETHQLTILR
jgi:hypothetical protein